MALGFEKVLIEKPGAVDRLDRESAVKYFKADEHVLSALKAAIIKNSALKGGV